ncbi:hypothetical protein [Candidatus Hydrogenosomobacter endosymbioticus]|uniref:Lipoprotein n=1 Tax=Candidatus Hydrogenosomobacter endosymbioticus TaxID=2558174 RepID=A0ABM7V996_9PROT|nr:hypothetical protein [Candidatus Hydrogenosomobacter endosymbioticus]BDB96046.1 hypothetical protein HYD_1790 [Candidatus Hydrogenosomobacter endosymbioticus]
MNKKVLASASVIICSIAFCNTVFGGSGVCNEKYYLVCHMPDGTQTYSTVSTHRKKGNCVPMDNHIEGAKNDCLSKGGKCVPF